MILSLKYMSYYLEPLAPSALTTASTWNSISHVSDCCLKREKHLSTTVHLVWWYCTQHQMFRSVGSSVHDVTKNRTEGADASHLCE